MLSTKIYQLDSDGNDVLVGTISLQDGKLVTSPSNSPFLSSVCRISIMGEGTEIIQPENAEKFLRSLPRAYHSAYLRATEVSDA